MATGMEQEALIVQKKKEVLEKMEVLMEQNPIEAEKSFRDLKKEFRKAWEELFEIQKSNFIEDGGRAKDFSYIKKEEDLRFEQLCDRFEKKLIQSKEELQKKLEKNLEIKRDIISRIRFLSENSENVGAALKMLNELKSEWKNAGEVPRAYYKEIHAEYNKALDDFHNRLKIFRELLEYDLQKNYELKQEIIQKIYSLQEKYNGNITEMLRAYRALKREWDSIGHVPPDKKTEIYTKLKEAEEQIQNIVQQFRQEQEKEMEMNAQSKRAILALMEKILENVATFKTQEEWYQATEEWKSHQNAWKEIGIVREEDNELLYREFRNLSDQFFAKKKEFFEELNRKKAQSRAMKAALAEEAEKWKDSTDWNEATKKIQVLQENWKKIPMFDHDPEEGKLYIRFKNACQHFFTRKQEHFQQLRSAIEEEIQKRKQFLESLSSVSLPEDKTQALAKLKEVEDEWASLGNARFDEKKELQNQYLQHIERLRNQVQLSPSEIFILKFENRIKQGLNSENPEDFFRKENKYLRSLYEETNQRLKNYENNKEFFRHAKKDNPLLKELEEKISKERQMLQDLDLKRKMLKKAWDEYKNGSQKTGISHEASGAAAQGS